VPGADAIDGGALMDCAIDGGFVVMVIKGR